MLFSVLEQFFELSIESKLRLLLVLHCFALWLATKTRATFSTNEDQNRALHRSQVISSNYELVIALYRLVVIG